MPRAERLLDQSVPGRSVAPPEAASGAQPSDESLSGLPVDDEAPPDEAEIGSSDDFGYHAGDLVAGKYELIRSLGEKDGAVSWVVQNIVLDAQFELKMIAHGGDRFAADRLLLEARSLARIEHPTVIRALDFGVTDRDHPFLVMDLACGLSVRELLAQRGRFTPIEAVRFLLPVADALSAAHAHGVVHGRVGADTILSVEEGAGRYQPKLSELGSVAPGSPPFRKARTEDLSRLEYLSPEQIRGQLDIDPRTDVWALCVVLYEMLTGHTPFRRSGNESATRHAIVNEPATPLSAHGVDDPVLASIISRGLEKLRADRWGDVRALGGALARWLLREGVESDASAHSIRTEWLEPSTSAPPVALDAPDVPNPGALAALAEGYDVPKRGALRSAFGIAIGVLALVLIATAGLVTVGASRSRTHASAPPSVQAARRVTAMPAEPRVAVPSVVAPPPVAPPPVAPPPASAEEAAPPSSQQRVVTLPTTVLRPSTPQRPRHPPLSLRALPAKVPPPKLQHSDSPYADPPK
jgi:serine/threonine protein kinase